MSLTLVPTPIGHPQDFSLRALEVLRGADHIIVEERKESTVWLRAHDIRRGQYETLNEHSTPEDLHHLTQLCASSSVALITDCGTPGFCDPGADLVRACRQKGIPVKALPGASSLMTLLSLSSERLDSFVFRGFLPAKTEDRTPAWAEVNREKRAQVLLETPYRLRKFLQELKSQLPERWVLLAINLTQDDEQTIEARARELESLVSLDKAEFVALVYSTNFSPTFKGTSASS